MIADLLPQVVPEKRESKVHGPRGGRLYERGSAPKYQSALKAGLCVVSAPHLGIDHHQLFSFSQSFPHNKGAYMCHDDGWGADEDHNSTRHTPCCTLSLHVNALSHYSCYVLLISEGDGRLWDEGCVLCLVRQSRATRNTPSCRVCVAPHPSIRSLRLPSLGTCSNPSHASSSCHQSFTLCADPLQSDGIIP